MKAIKKLWKRVISAIIAVSLVWTGVFSHINFQANETPDLTLQETENSEATMQSSFHTVNDVFEVEELREKTVKHFRLQDGSYVAVQYEAPVHVKDEEGKWQNVDNTIVEAGNELTTQNAKIKFAKKITGNEELFTLHDGNYKITMSLDNAIKKTEGSVNNPSAIGEEVDDEVKLQKMIQLENLSSSVCYNDILSGIDLEYVVNAYNIKENIIVKEKQDIYQYTFTIKLNNLEAVLCKDGSVRIYSPETDETLYRMPAGFMYDANEVYSADVTYALAKIGQGRYSLTVSADAEWINAEERVFPVCIDPTVSITGEANYKYAAIDYYDPYTRGDGSLFAGNSSIAYLKPQQLPTLPYGAVITDASLSLIGRELNANGLNVSPTLVLGTYPVLTEWNLNYFSYHEYELNGEGQVSDYAYDAYQSAQSVTNGNTTGWQYTWDITQHVLEWYERPQENYGLAITSIDKTSTNQYPMVVFSQTFDNVASIQIRYTMATGLEDYWSYTTQNVGAAGTGYVNNTTGKLTFVVGSFSRADFLFGHNISLVYNQEYVGRCPSTVSAGYGFKLNTSEYLLSSSYINAQGEEVVYYIWTDSDGTQHDFMPDEEVSNLYRDVDGLLLTLKIENGNYLMQDMSHNKRLFKSISIGSSSIVAVLNYEEDQNGNKLYYTNNDIGQNSAISLVPKGGSNIPFEQYTYNNYGCVKEISMTNDANAQKVRLYYSPNYYRTSNISGDYSGYLKKIEYIKNNQVIATTSYEYDNTGRLTAAYDEKTWCSVHYTYSDGKVSAVQEIGSNQEIGQKLGLSYGNGYSEVRSSGTDDVYGTSDDIITRYIYDRNGRVTSTYSTDVNRTKIYGAASGEYETQENIKNNIKTSIAIGGSASNYIYNGGFEKRTSSTSASGWNTINNITFVNGENNNRNHHGNYSARIDIARNTSYVLQQNVFLPAGEYTLSMDIKSYEAEHVQIIMQASSQNGTGNGKNERISVNEDNASDGFVNYSLHFKASNYNSTGGEQFRIEIAVISDSEFVGDASYVVIDNVMLEESIGQSGYSMVEFGNFEDFHRTGTKATYKTVWTTSGAVITEHALLGKVLKLDPDGSISSSRASQTIYTASSVQTDTTPKTFIVSGMGKGTYQVASGNFEIQVKVTYADNTVDTYFIAFQDYFTDWQFVSKSITTANKLVKKVVVDVVYENNPGVGYFDNIYVTQVVNESLVTNEYYENGLIQVQRNGYYEEVYEYNNNNNLTRMANNRGELYDYTYTSTNDVDTVTYSSFSSSVGNSLSYPYEYADAHNLITTVPKTTTDYNYNRYGLATSTEIYNGTNYTNSTQRVRSSYTYEMSSTRNFGALTSETDELGITTQYFYDTSTGNLLASLNTNKRTGICYTYDVMGNIATVNPATYVTNGVYQAGTGGVSYTYDTTNLLQSITTQSTTYEFAYDNFGNAESVDIGANEIVRYEYNSNNGKLNTIYYANGFSVEYEYDEFDNISKVWYSEGDTEPLLAYEYKYNAYGQLYQFNNLLTEKSIIYSYDANKRLIDFVEYDTDDLVNAFATKFVYDDKSRISRIQYSLDYQSDAFGVDTIANSEVTYWLSYNSDNSISRIGITTPYASGGTNYTYDIFKRVASKYSEYTQGISANTFKNTVTYEYATRGNYDDSTLNSPYSSSLIRKYTSKVNDYATLTYTYTYDDNGNITKIKRSDGKEFRYVYDSLDQLIREDNSELNKTYIYSYDSAGNIVSKTVYPLTAVGATLPAYTDKINYEYNDSNWGDKLTSYDGNSITYDAIGNPLSYFNGSRWTFTWKNGRRLATASTYGYTLSFEYNDEGIRTSKTVNGVEHAYQLNGSQIVAEVWGGKQLLYFYDADESPIGMQYRDLMDDAGVYESYWFEKNLQGDIVKVYSANGTLLVSYSYDAWGSASVQYHNGGGSTNAVYNPFRYRGYYYDAETELYYVSSRYYNPEIGRWINADALISTGQGILGCNMFAYCGNNPVNREDSTGQFWEELLEVFVQTIKQNSAYFVAAIGFSQADSPMVGPADVASAVMVIGGLLVYGGYAVSTVINAQMDSISIPKAKEKTVAIPVPKEPDSLVTFPVDPNDFNPVGLVKVPRAGTKNGAIISWMDPHTKTEVFRWDENPNYSNGPHYHIYGTGHYYAGDIVPEPYSTIYFPYR